MSAADKFAADAFSAATGDPYAASSSSSSSGFSSPGAGGLGSVWSSEKRGEKGNSKKKSTAGSGGGSGGGGSGSGSSAPSFSAPGGNDQALNGDGVPTVNIGDENIGPDNAGIRISEPVTGNAKFDEAARTPDSAIDAQLYSFEKTGKEAYKVNKYEQCYTAFSHCLAIAPPIWSGRPRVLGNRAAAYMMSHKFVLAANDCETALNLDASMVKLHVRRARCMLRMGMFSKTEEICTKVLGLDNELNQGSTKGDQDVVSAKKEARKCLDELATAQDLTKRLQGAEAVLDYDKVVSVCTSITEMCPMFRVAHAAKAKALNKLCKWAKAKSFTEEVLCPRMRPI